MSLQVRLPLGSGQLRGCLQYAAFYGGTKPNRVSLLTRLPMDPIKTILPENHPRVLLQHNGRRIRKNLRHGIRQWEESWGGSFMSVSVKLRMA